MSRRVGQSGNVFQHDSKSSQWNPAARSYGRFWVDSGSKRKRRTIVLGVCPTRTVARRKLREHLETEQINSKQTFTSNTGPATTFEEQSAKWVASLEARKRKPLKPATLFAWRNILDKHLIPTIGDVLLADVNNGCLKSVIEKLSNAEPKLSPKTIVNYASVVKWVVASALNPDGEELYPRKWNHDFVEWPIVEKKKQHRPSLTVSELLSILGSFKAKGKDKRREKYRILFALLAGSGLRIGECLGLEAADFSSDCRVLSVRRSVWRSKIQSPKSEAALREVDLAEPLARLLRAYVASKRGYLFATRSGQPLEQRNVLRMLHTIQKVGLHSFRRFRAEVLRRAGVPQDLFDYWMGHSDRNLADLYAGGLDKDYVRRSQWSEQAGLGFELGYFGLQDVKPSDLEKAA
jgi:integrase